MHNYKELRVWKQAILLATEIYNCTKEFPKEEKYGLSSQMQRAAVSIASNIAEGSAKRSEKDYIRFVEISFGSAFELETHLLIVQKRKWVEDKMIVELLDNIKTEQKMLAKFIDKVGS